MRKKVRGFTLIELVVVLAIISILGAIIVPNTIRQIKTNRIASANTQAQQIYSAAADYMVSLQRRGYTKADVCAAFGVGHYVSLTGPTYDYMLIGYDKDSGLFYGGGTNNAAVTGWTIAGNAMKPAAYSGIVRYLAGSTSAEAANEKGFWTEGSWAAIVNTKTYSVVAACYNCQKSNTGFGTTTSAVKTTVNYLYTSVDEQEKDVFGLTPDTFKLDRAYTGQYPIPRNP